MTQTRNTPEVPDTPGVHKQAGRPRGSVALLPTARALLLPPSGRRQLAAAVVLRCPHCRRSHLHRGGKLNASVRWSGCRPAREYVLAVRL
jgi:hypothetical protein